MKIETAKDLEVYRLGYELAMIVFELTETFPSEEKYALTSQIRRSSRSVCLNLEKLGPSGVMKRISSAKLTDCDEKTARLIHRSISLTPATTSQKEQHEQLTSRCAELGRMLGTMMKKAESFCQFSDI